ncbi:DUF1990 family protein [Streptomyces sp. JJ36]|uniref:DUF1990 family protein n=1 Tax=Streptomyces sp. JJ36 TaxID=2736645 RepID=UPI001F4043BF|nr:DUF1990 domain-containing protein [Streptomyces sp. JJ36]
MTETPQYTYAAVGATAAGRWPAGFARLRFRTRVGTGAAAFRTAARAVLEWRMHRTMGVRMDTSAGRAAPGVRVRVGLGPGRARVTAPCRVVWAEEGDDRAGWAYGTLPGHPVRGEESFVVERGPDGVVWLTVTAFSRPAVWWTRAAGPLLPLAQRAYAHRCGTALRRIVRTTAER